MTTGDSLNTSYSTHFNRNMTFASPDLENAYQANREKLLSSHANHNHSANDNSRCKRRTSEDGETLKKTKQESCCSSNHIPVEQLTLENIDLSEYPQFNHPNGGIIQFTPIGNIRTIVGDDNVVQRVIEKESTFDMNHTDRGIDGYRLYLGEDNKFAKETESYMRDGYVGNTNGAPSSHYHNPGSCGCCNGSDYDCDSDLDDDDDFYMH